MAGDHPLSQNVSGPQFAQQPRGALAADKWFSGLVRVRVPSWKLAKYPRQSFKRHSGSALVDE